MSKRKRQSKSKLPGKSRLSDERKWLVNHPQKDLLGAYSKRYAVNRTIADEKLTTLGYYDELFIQHYEKKGLSGSTK